MLMQELEAAQALLQLGGNQPEEAENYLNTEAENAQMLVIVRCCTPPNEELNAQQQTGSPSPLPHAVAQNDNSGSVCDSEENIISFCDQATQTEESCFSSPARLNRGVEDIEASLMIFYTRFVSFVSQLNVDWNQSESSDHNEEVNIAPNDSSIDPNNPAHHVSIEEFVEELGAEEVVEDNVGELQVNSLVVKTRNQLNINPNTERVRRMSVQTNNNIEHENDDDNMIPIGDGNAKVPARVLKGIDWNSHTSATRQLLKAIFPRRVLATHSLTGKRSPAFLNRPAKKMLNPQIVDDIVKTVSTKCGVSRSIVRNCITIKCTDEAKLYRNRQQSGQNRQGRKPLHPNDENVRPSTSSS